MSVVGMLRQTCSLSRSVPVGTNGRTQPQQLYPSLSCMVLPMNNTTAIAYDFSLGRAFDFYFADGTDVQIGDRLTFNGATYMVKSVKPYSGFGVTSYMQVLTEQEVS